MRNLVACVALTLVACDSSGPEVHDFTPRENQAVRGMRTIPVDIAFSDESTPVTVKLALDGTKHEDARVECEEERCVAYGDIPTAGLAIGNHTLEATLEDDAGNTTRVKHAVWIDDVLEVRAIQVGAVPESGALEIEVYLFDDATGELLGCSGSRHGLNVVNAPDTTYDDLRALFINPQSLALITRDLADRDLRVEVWEDDDDPVCPVVPAALGNNLVGMSEPVAGADLGGAEPMAFPQVPMLQLQWTRDLATDPGPSEYPDDPGGNQLDLAGGCAASSPGLLVALAYIMIRRPKKQKARREGEPSKK